MVLKVEHIAKKYKNNFVLRDISFVARDGECIGFVGANGCGKTTLLSILVGVEIPDKGKLTLDGKKLSLKSGISRSHVGYVPQINPLPERLTVKECLKLWCDDKEAYHKALTRYDLADIEKKQIGKLSGGMKRRVAIACALSNDPDILVMDEPTAALDIHYKELIHGDMSKFVERGGLLIVVTHEKEEIEMCTTCYKIENGEITNYGESE